MTKKKQPAGNGDKPESEEWQPPKSQAETIDRVIMAIVTFFAKSGHPNPADPEASAALAELKRLHLYLETEE